MQHIKLGLDESLTIRTPIGDVVVSCIDHYCGPLQAYQPIVRFDPERLVATGLETRADLTRGVRDYHSLARHQKAMQHRRPTFG